MSKNVTEWLETIGFSQYAEQFVANDMGMDLLPELNHELLGQIGVSSVGHRLRILKAAAALSEPNPGTPDAPGPKVTQPDPLPATAERRQLTVMFCDLVDSTGLSTRLDPEDLREVVRAYQQTAEQVIQRFDGHIAQYLGDGLLVYFGYPQAHENDAERAVFAGLGVPAAMTELNVHLRREYGVELSVRIGIHTGPVVVGQMGGDSRQENLALGETPNLAARLEGLAQPDCVIISDSTRRLLGESFALEALGPHTLKGISTPIAVFTVRGEGSVESRFSSEHTSDAGAIVGRDKNLNMLKHCWQSALEGDGQLVLLSGEAGIGKSRVVRGLTDALVGTEYIRLTYQCSPYHTDTALYPAFTQLKRAADIQTSDSSDQQLDKLEVLLRKGSDDISEAAPLLGSMMGMGDAVRRRYGDLDFSPNEQRTKALQVLSAQLFSLTRKRPVLFIIEDVHWIDPSTLALTELLLDSAAGHRVLVLTTARPGFEDNYGDHSNLTRIALSRLSREQANQIINRITRGKKLPADLVEEILSKADGVPLFIEEITKTLIESGGLIETAGSFELSGVGGRLAVPSSLQDSLMARLDKLRSIKVVAQTAACIGREFGFSLLNAVLPMAQNTLALALNQLVSNELISVQGEPPEATYSFRHALVRDAAYDSQLKARRQQVHREILKRLEEEDTAPQVLAHHAAEANLPEIASEYWEQAGNFALSQPAYLEAIGSYERSLQALRRFSGDTPSKESQRRELDLTTRLLRALIAGRGLTHADTRAAIESERRLQEEVGDSSRHFEVMFNVLNVHIGAAEFDKVRELAEKLVAEAEHEDDPMLRSMAYRIRGFSIMASGDFTGSLPDFERALARYHPDQDAQTMKRFGINNGIALKCSMSQTLMGLGMAGRAVELLEGIEQAARNINVPATLGFALSSMATSYQLGRWPNAKQFAVRSLNEVRSYQLVAWVNNLECIVAAALYEDGEYAEAVELLEHGIRYRRESGGLIFVCYHLALQAACLFALGRQSEAELLEQEVLHMLEHGTERWAEAECHRLLACASYQRDGQSEVVITRLKLAIDIARRQGASGFELRAATDLANILKDLGLVHQAKDVLLPVIASFPQDGHILPDYIQAEKLLAQVSS